MEHPDGPLTQRKVEAFDGPADVPVTTADSWIRSSKPIQGDCRE